MAVRGLVLSFLSMALSLFTVLLPAAALAGADYDADLEVITKALAAAVEKAGSKRVAVVDLIDLKGNASELGRFLAEELSTNLVTATKGFQVVDRGHLRSLLNEHKLSISGLVNSENAKKLGKFAGVDALITGSITPSSESVHVTVKVLDVETATLLAAAKGSVARTKFIDELLRSPVAGAAVVVTTPAIAAGAAAVAAGTTAPAAAPAPESSNAAAPAPESSNAAAPVEPQPSNPGWSFEQRSVKVSVTAIDVLPGQSPPQVTISLSYQSRRKNPVALALNSQGARWESHLASYPAYVTDDTGNKFALRDAPGISGGHHLVIDKDGPVTATLTFERIGGGTSVLDGGGERPELGQVFALHCPHLMVDCDDKGRFEKDRNGNAIGVSSFDVTIRGLKPAQTK